MRASRKHLIGSTLATFTVLAVLLPTTPALSNHSPSPTSSEPGDFTIRGTSAEFSHADHQHARESFGFPAPLAENAFFGSEGVSSSVARADHVHAWPQNVPRGHLAASTTTTETTGIMSAEVELTALRTNANVGFAQRWIKATLNVRINASLPGTTADVYIYRDSDRIGGASVYIAAAGGAGAITLPITAVEAVPTGGTHTYSVTVKRTAGSGTVTASVPGGTRQYLLIEDMGE